MLNNEHAKNSRFVMTQGVIKICFPSVKDLKESSDEFLKKFKDLPAIAKKASEKDRIDLVIDFYTSFAAYVEYLKTISLGGCCLLLLN